MLLTNASGIKRVDLLTELACQYSGDSALNILKTAQLEAKKLKYSAGLAEIYYIKAYVTYVHFIYAESIRNRVTKSIVLFDSARQLHTILKNEAGIARDIYFLGLCYYDIQENEKAIQYFQNALTYEVRLQNLSMQGMNLNRIGNAYYAQGNIRNALRYFSEAMDRFKNATMPIKFPDSGNKAELKFYKAHNTFNVGILYSRTGNLPQALRLYYDAAEQFSATNDYSGQGHVWKFIGQVFIKQGKYADALRCYRKSYKLGEKSWDRTIACGALRLMGEYYLQIHDYDSALQTLQGALDRTKKHDFYGLFDAHRALGDLFIATKDYDQAVKYYRQALEHAVSISANGSIAKAHIKLGRAMLLKKQYREAERYLNEALQRSTEMGDKEYIKESCEALSVMHSAMNHHQLAFTYHQQVIAMNDSLMNETKQNQIHGANLTYELKSREKQNELLKKENEIDHETIAAQKETQFILGASALALVILGLVISVAFYQKQKANSMLIEQNQVIGEQGVQIRLKNIELTEALEELKLTQTQLVRSEKMASLGMFTAGVAHEINNPINFIYGGVQALEENIDSLKGNALKEMTGKKMAFFSAIESDISSIKNSVNKAISIITRLKSFVHPDDKVVRGVDLRESIESTLGMLTGKIKKVQLVKDFKAIPPVTCNPGQINQILLNIIDNALYAIGMVSRPGVIVITTNVEDRWVVVSVKDNGRGIDRSVQSKIFDPFFTTKGFEKRSGLGLHISYNIAKEHGGSLTFKSEPGVGTEFFLTLPQLPDAIASQKYLSN
ncbi:MAG: tetratricopeptide repeat protein [Bacteroidota bacterium]